MVRDKNNVYAQNVKGDVIHASEADSGRQGYYCLGCKMEMQAVRSKTSKRVDYFRHDPKGVVSETKCTYSDETYRHKLAKEILQRIKRIKVPAVYKYPPKGHPGLANLLIESMYIEAAHVGIERTFYEDESGVIYFGSNVDVESRFLIVRPDVTFFDRDNKPILFIEIVVSHKISTEKLIKLKRLGVDTIQIRIPKDSPESIENNFHKTNMIKWVYNKTEEATQYVPVAERNSKEILPLDELQRKLFEESFECRTSEIRNVIREIARCLGSEPYRKSESDLREELSRVERNTEEHRARLDKLREEHRRRVAARYQQQIDEIEDKTRQVEQKHKNLEERYNRKRIEISNNEGKLRPRNREKLNEGAGGGSTFEQRKGGIIADKERALRDFEKEQGELLENIERGRNRISQIIGSRETIPARFKQLEATTSRQFESLEEGEKKEIERISGDTKNESRVFGETTRTTESEFEELRRRSFDAVKARDCSGNNELSRRIIELFQTRRRLIDYEENYATFQRNRSAWECFKEGTYKNWTH
jgi:hypothetical protein